MLFFTFLLLSFHQRNVNGQVCLVLQDWGRRVKNKAREERLGVKIAAIWKVS